MSEPGKISRGEREEGGWKQKLSSILLLPSPFLVVLIFLLSVTIVGCWGPVRSVTMSSSVGNELTREQRFTLKGIHDEVVDLDQLLAKNKAVLIDFWATWCGYCVEEMPGLIKLQTENQPRGFTVVAVDVGESKEQASLFAKKMGINFPIALDDDNTVSQKYNVVGIPLSYLVNSKGQILGEYHAYDRRLEDDVNKALEASSA